MKDGPFKKAIEKEDEDTISMQQFIVLKSKNGQLVKETHMRNHTFYGAYQDSYMTAPLVNRKARPKETVH